MSSTMKIDRAGRLMIPLTFRTELGLSEGSEIIVRLEDGELRLTTKATALRRAQEALRKFQPAGESVVDGFLAERREEAGQEKI